MICWIFENLENGKYNLKINEIVLKCWWNVVILMVNFNFGKINVIFEDNNMFIEKIDINVESVLFFSYI